jgi:Glu-tRNA(Gln) amidotransferase subunit E-like FAD-binding protein
METLTGEEILKEIDKLNNILPASIIEELKAKLQNIKLTKENLKKILDRVVNEYLNSIAEPGEPLWGRWQHSPWVNQAHK